MIASDQPPHPEPIDLAQRRAHDRLMAWLFAPLDTERTDDDTPVPTRIREPVVDLDRERRERAGRRLDTTA